MSKLAASAARWNDVDRRVSSGIARVHLRSPSENIRKSEKPDCPEGYRHPFEPAHPGCVAPTPERVRRRLVWNQESAWSHSVGDLDEFVGKRLPDPSGDPQTERHIRTTAPIPE